MNDVLQALLAGDYALGLERYGALPEPIAPDHRWAGLCALNLGEPFKARDLLLQARAQGCLAANIELASVARQIGDTADAVALLEQLNPQELSAFDGTLYWREHFVSRFGANDLAQAARAAEQAWVCTFEALDAQRLRPGIGQCLGMVYAARGQDRRADTYFTAALEMATPGRRSYLLMARAASRSRSGRHDEAQADLEEAAQLATHVPAIRPVLAYHQGHAAWGRGAFAQAEMQWQAAIQFAQEGHEAETEGYAQLGLAAIATQRGDINAARQHLARTSALQVTALLRALTTLRRGALAIHHTDAAGIALLEDALTQFTALGREREAGWAEMHLAEARLLLGQTEAAECLLRRVTDRRYALGSGAAFVPELRGLLHVQALLAQRAPNEYCRVLLDDAHNQIGTFPFEIRLITLGAARLLVDGRPARLDLARSAELLAYLLLHPGQTLNQLVATLSPDDDPKKAKNYVHQARYDLERAAPGMDIPPGRDRTYSVRCQGPALTWDVWDLQSALQEHSEQGMERALQLYAGPFLPGAESTWAGEERADMAWSMVRVGLELIEEWYAQQQYDKCVTLAGRLLEVDPYDEPLGEYLVKAARALQGDVTARRAVNRLLARHQQEMGDVPPALMALQRELNQLN